MPLYIFLNIDHLVDLTFVEAAEAVEAVEVVECCGVVEWCGLLLCVLWCVSEAVIIDRVCGGVAILIGRWV